MDISNEEKLSLLKKMLLIRAFEEKADGFINITYTAPTETGEIEQTVADASDMPAVHPSAFAGVSRNDPCPCGSGKKYKHCHGKLQ